MKTVIFFSYIILEIYIENWKNVAIFLKNDIQEQIERALNGQIWNNLSDKIYNRSLDWIGLGL